MAFGIFVLSTIHLHVFCKIDGGLLRFIAVPAAKPRRTIVHGFRQLELILLSLRCVCVKDSGSKGVSSKMISFGFRIKLLLAMLAVVGATTAVSLMVALQRVEAANDRLFLAGKRAT